MKWLVYYSKIDFEGKGEPYSRKNIIGFSNLDEKDLFKVLKREYPNLQIRKAITVDEYHIESYDINGVKDEYSLYQDFVYFTSNNLKEF